MNQNFVKSAVAATLLIAGTIGFSACSSSDEKKSESSAKVEKQTLTNVSYDPTRELYANYNDIVFLVRKGNPKNLKDWGDLVKDGIGVITPNPKTSGGARWNYLAAWAWAEKQYNGDEAKVKEFVKKLYKNVLVLASGARGSTTTFIENGQGDVLLAWENEAFLSLKDYPNDYEIVIPSVSILAEPSVAIVDKVVDKRGTRELATEYLNFLYSDEGQHIAAKNHYRPSNKAILDQYKEFDQNVNLIDISYFGGWDKAQGTHFSNGGIFDQIYEKK